MRRVPIVATTVVTAAIATMIWLGIWQIQRARWKEGLLASYRAAALAPQMNGLPRDAGADRVAFRRTALSCTIVTDSTQIGGPGPDGRTGYRNIAGCRLGDGRTIMVDLGWNAVGVTASPLRLGEHIEGRGRLIPDDVLARRILPDAPKALSLLLVLESPAPGLAPSTAPSIETIPNNHRGYAVQWFLFAGVALVIYLLALRKRYKAG